ncbi:MAG: hypothetical protein AAF065_01640 [Verrucomicrobiota bacterium]
MKKSAITGLIVASALSFAGCSTTLSEKEQSSITSVGTVAPVIGEDAYKEPNARQNPGTANAGGAAGGFIGSLVGSAIDASVMASQQKSFEETNEQYFETIEQTIPEDFSQRLEAAIIQAIEKDPFFGPKLTTESEYKFTADVNNYGLTIASKVGDEVKLAFRISADVALKGKAEKKVFGRPLFVESRSSHTLEEYNTNKDLLGKVIEECLSAFSSQFGVYLDQKLGRL